MIGAAARRDAARNGKHRFSAGYRFQIVMWAQHLAEELTRRSIVHRQQKTWAVNDATALVLDDQAVHDKKKRKRKRD